jgi:hypothetical protein
LYFFIAEFALVHPTRELPYACAIGTMANAQNYC